MFIVFIYVVNVIVQKESFLKYINKESFILEKN